MNLLQSGIPIPYSPKTDDGIAIILLVCFIFSAYVLARSKKFLLQEGKDFFLNKERTSLFVTSAAANMRYLLLLALQTCLLLGICFLNYFDNDCPLLVQKIPPGLLLAIYVGTCLVYFLFYWGLYAFLGWIFFDKNRTELWLHSYSTIVYYLGFVLFPFILFLVYFDLDTIFMIIIGLCFIFLAKILIFYKWIKLFFSNIHGLLLLILYFCALEIIPCFVYYQALVKLNNLLLIKF